MKRAIGLLFLLNVCVAFFAMTAIEAADWPQWRGPDRNGISKETGLFQEWPKEGPALAWKVDKLGGGDSAPTIANGQIFLMSNLGEDEVVWALSEKDGQTIWKTRLAPAFNQRTEQSKEGPSCSPTVDGEHLYVEGLAGNVVCLRIKDGGIVWQRSLTQDFGGRMPMWSFRESPLVDGDKVICTPGGADAALVALNKLTGETIWKAQMGSNTEANASATAPAPSRPSGAPSAGTAVTGTKDPGLFVGEHFSMSAFSQKVPNGKYTAKLYFAETYEGITGPGQRVFSLNVQGQEFKDFDVWVKAGGANRAYIESVPAEVTDGEFRVTFTPKVENPAIKAIEIIPQAESTSGTASATAIRIKAGRSEPFTDSSGQVWRPDEGFEGGMINQMTGGAGGAPGGAPGGASRPDRAPGGFGGPGGGSGAANAAYSSVIAIDFDGQRQYVQFFSNALAGFASSDGKFLWRYDKPANRMGLNCSTPLSQDGLVFASSAYGAGGGLVMLSKDSNGGVKAEEVYATRDMQSHHGGMILFDGSLYGATGGNEGGALACLNFETGKVQWDQRPTAGRQAKGSLTMAGGRLYYRMENGTVLLIEPSAKEYLERGRFEQPERRTQPAWAYPVVANGKLYIRDQDLLFCYDVKAK